MKSKETHNAIEIMEKLFLKDYENKICVECKASMPSFVSINNAIIICKNCADKHQKLGYNISYIREIKNDWDPYLFSYFQRGGNSRFILLSKKYDLDNIPIEKKFTTKILEYYRLLLKSEVLADEPPLEIPIERAKEQIEDQSIYFPEFENYELFKIKQFPVKQNSSIFNAFKYIGSGLGAMYNGLKIAGNYIYNSSKPNIKDDSNKTMQNVGNLCKQAEYHLNGEEDNKEEEKENNNKEKNKTNEKKINVKNNFSLLDINSNLKSGISLQEGDIEFGDNSLISENFPFCDETNMDKFNK